MSARRACLCCGHPTISSRSADYQICPECRWEDDPISYDQPDFVGGANGVSLNQARAKYRAHGSSRSPEKSSS
ncbi:MAG: CPCC family cysteine-rich protein [Hyphomonadaceae bacterium]